jgi:hypothetical protein
VRRAWRAVVGGELKRLGLRRRGLLVADVTGTRHRVEHFGLAGQGSLRAGQRVVARRSLRKAGQQRALG